jgi:hypothetical protein
LNAIKRKWWDLAELMIDTFYMREGIDCMDVFIEARKELEDKEDIKNFEFITGLMHPF